MTSAVVVGAGPNGLTAAAVLARAGVSVTILERAERIGGATASAPVFGEGTIVDLGAAAHPFGVASHAFRELELERHGLEWAHPAVPVGHPFQDAPAALIYRDAERTAAQLGVDAAAWRRLHDPVTRRPLDTAEAIFAPLVGVPPHPLLLGQIGVRGALPASVLARLAFRSGAARALLAGCATHATLPLGRPLTAAFGLAFAGVGHATGWPFARGGSGAITAALARVAEQHGARIELRREVRELDELPEADLVLLDLAPRHLLRLAQGRLNAGYARRLKGWRYGPAVSKADFLLDGPVPWADERLAGAGTVHLGGRLEEIEAAERAVAAGRMPERPFILITQPSSADPSRAPAGRHILWSYAHVPHGWPGDAGEAIEREIERVAPGFRDRILERRTMPPAALEAWNPNLVGGAIGGGSIGGTQQLARPRMLSPYRVPVRGRRGVFLCSSSAAPGGGAHGMAGWHAARAALRSLG